MKQNRIVAIGLTLMAVSAFTQRNGDRGDCFPCGLPIIAGSAHKFPLDTVNVDSIYVVGVYDPARDPTSDLSTAIERASAEGKRILIQVGGEWCVWCHILDEFIRADKEILSALGRDFLIVKVNFDNVNRNEAFLSKYPPISGYPHVYVLEHDGRFLHSQQTDELEEGRSYSRTAVLTFLRKWAAER